MERGPYLPALLDQLIGLIVISELRKLVEGKVWNTIRLDDGFVQEVEKGHRQDGRGLFRIRLGRWIL